MKFIKPSLDMYVCESYVRFLKKHGFEISMSSVGTPQDNAFIEAFFKTLKKEKVYFKNYQNMNDVLENLPNFIEEVYNKKRLHSSLRYLTPEEFERKVMKIESAETRSENMGQSCLVNGAQSRFCCINH